MTDLFGYEKIRTIGLCQPFGSLMLHGKKESRKVKKGKRPGFPLGKYLLYTTKEPYSQKELNTMCGDNLISVIQETLVNEPTSGMNGYAIVLADLVKVRKMTVSDSRSAFIVYLPNLRKHTWLLEFRNVQRIKPFKFEYGKQGIGFLPEPERLKIQIL